MPENATAPDHDTTQPDMMDLKLFMALHRQFVEDTAEGFRQRAEGRYRVLSEVKDFGDFLLACRPCRIQHWMSQQTCPSCGVNRIPQPVSIRIRKKCRALYICEACYRDHQA